MQTRTAFRPFRPTAAQLLFLRYISGQIAEVSWRQFTQVFDEAGATPQERDALAQFYSDALKEFGPESVSVPKLGEVEDLLVQMRAEAV